MTKEQLDELAKDAGELLNLIIRGHLFTLAEHQAHEAEVLITKASTHQSEGRVTVCTSYYTASIVLRSIANATFQTAMSLCHKQPS